MSRFIARKAVAIVSIIALAAVTSWMTMKNIEARAPQARHAHEESRLVPVGPARHVPLARPPQRPPAGSSVPLGPDAPIMQYGISGDMVQSRRTIVIACHADYSNKLAGTVLAWRVRLLDPDDGSVIRSTLYDHKRLHAPAGHRSFLEFNDAINLSPGRYRVEVGYVAVTDRPTADPDAYADTKPIKAITRMFTIE